MAIDLERLKILAEEGLSGREIAKVLGVTKGVVMGNVHRHKIHLKGQRLNPFGRKKPQQQKQQQATSATIATGATTIVVKVKAPVLCKWPDGCKKERIYGKSYCLKHYDICYRKPAKWEKALMK